MGIGGAGMDVVDEGDKLLVATVGRWAFVRVVGRGSFKVSSVLKKFLTVMMEEGCLNHALDMHRCTGLDSTFMGVLAGIALRLKRRDQGGLVMLNVSSKIANLLETIGLRQLIRTYAVGQGPDDLLEDLRSDEDLSALDMAPEDKRSTTLTMLDAHESLIEAAPRNFPKFKDVLAYLKEDLHESDGSE